MARSTTDRTGETGKRPGRGDDPRHGPRLTEHELQEALHAGAALFETGAFWEAHEAWEAGWHRAPPQDRDFFQGLIHVAAACLHHRNGNAHGFARQKEKMHLRLGAYPDVHRDVHVAQVQAAVDGLPPPGEKTSYPRLGLRSR